MTKKYASSIPLNLHYSDVVAGYFFLRYETLHDFIPYFYRVYRNMLPRLCNLSVAEVLRNGVQWRSVLLKKFFKSSVREKKFVSLLYQINN